MITEGSKAPDFSLLDEKGDRFTLDFFKGKKIVLYFYPKDDTPGCTTEACAFRDVYDQILEKGAVVIGVSADAASSHQKFKSKYKLPFHLLSDPDRKCISAYGAWGEKTMMGKKYMGIIRSTFVIDENGTVIKTFPEVTPKEHAAQVLAVL
jgi:peroxiredoxin Q/BCP